MTRLLLVRHGETVDNVNKIMQGQTHGRLTLNGIEQAHELGRQLRGEHIDVFLSSDLARAVETLEIIKQEKTLPLTPPVREGSEMPLGGSGSQSEEVSTPLPYGRGRGEGLLLPSERGLEVGLLLRERDWGSFTGRYIPDLQNEVWPDDIETLDAMKARARQFLDFVRDNYPGKTVLAVGHGIINKAIQSVYLGKPMNEIQKMANCEVRVLEL
jgi:probable phosphoglycerate mutase